MLCTKYVKCVYYVNNREEIGQLFKFNDAKLKSQE